MRSFDRGLAVIRAKIRPLTLPDFFIDHDKPDKQLEAAGLDVGTIVATALQALGQEKIESPAVRA